MHDGAIPVHQTPGQLVVEVPALVGDLAVLPGQLPLELPTAVGAPSFAG